MEKFERRPLAAESASARSRAKGLVEEAAVLLRNIPAWTLALFVSSLVAMNLLANKSITGLPSWLALDAGIIVSWVSFAMMDITVRRFGLRGANIFGMAGIAMNLFAVAVFFLASRLPGQWSASFGADGSSSDSINLALDSVFGGTWYVVLGSTAAAAASILCNNLTNVLASRLARGKKFASFAARSVLSTLAGQFTDNFTFALLVSVPFFGWSLVQAASCAAAGAAAELFCEALFLPASYKVVRAWERNGVGAEYIERFRPNLSHGI